MHVRLLRSASLSLLLQLWAAACGPPAEPAPPPRAAVTPGPELPALQRARLDYVFDAAERVERSWAFMRPADTCVLLIEPEAQWVLQCDQAPPGFTPAGAPFRDRPVYHHAGGSFTSAGRMRSAAELLSQTPAAAHVPRPGAQASGALPGQQPWLVLGSLEALAAFHPAFPEATTEAWVSVAIHELIHTHQLRAPGAAPLLVAIESGARDPGALTRLFGRDPRYRALVEREYALLVSAAERPPQDRRSARQALRAWLALHARRTRHLAQLQDAARLLEDDALFSYLEGAARFVESDFLDNVSQQPDTTPANDPRFRAYALFRGRGYAGSPNRQLDEQYFYAIGYHLCVLLERLDPGWKAHAHEAPQHLFSLVQQVASAAD